MSSIKRRRSDADSSKKESPLTRADVTTAPAKSILDSTEAAFPRGGASALTPLELKEVANEAAQDVLFERENASLKHDDQRPSKKKKVSKSTKALDASEKENIKIETLSFKSLVPGTLVLGQITEINRLDIALSLPDNLVGYIPITSISSTITKQLEEFNEDSDVEEPSDDEDNGNTEDSEKVTLGTKPQKTFPSLSSYFKVGQWLRAIVVESSKTKSKAKNQKKRIQLSIETEKVNKTLDEDDLIANTTVQAEVSSVEDHGVIFDIGKTGLTAFISNKEIKLASYEPSEILKGSLFLATIVSNKGRTLTVKLTSTKKNVVSTVSSIDSVVPGNLVDALVTEVTNEGIVTKVLGLINGTISLAHIGVFTKDELKHNYGIGTIIKARVTAVILSGGSKKLVLSLISHHVSLKPLDYDPETTSAPLEAFPIGHIFEEVEIKGHDSNYIYVSVGDQRFGQVHISRIDGDKSSLSTLYGVGTKHQARILGFSQLDNYYILTLDPKVIKQKYLRAEDIPLGELVNGEIISVSADTGLKIKIFEKFEAIVSPSHMSDVKLIYPERKFKIGSKVKGRVLNVSKYKSEIFVTFKKSLVGNSNLVTKIEDAKVGDRTPVSVLSFKPNGAIVSFFGSLKGFLPKSEISETFVRKPEDHLRLGQTVTVRIVSVDIANKRIVVSCKLLEESSSAQKKALDDLVVGKSVVNAQIVEKTKDSVVVALNESSLKGVIFAGHLSDGNYEQNRAILKRLEVGSSIEGLVLDKDVRSRVFNLSAKKSLIDAAKKDILPVKFEDVRVSDQSIPGYVKSITNKGIFVGFGAKLVGLVLAKYATDRPVDDLNTVFYPNQSLSVRILRTDDENKRFLLTLKEKKTSSTDVINPVDSKIQSISDYVAGTITKAIIKSVKQTQLNVQLADNVQGRIDATQIFEKFDDIKDSKQPLAEFQKGDVLDVKVIGFHDARTHRFLPITHKKSKQVIIELSAKKSDLQNSSVTEIQTIDSVAVGSEWISFINNSNKGFFYVSLSPLIKGTISFMDLSSDAKLLNDLEESFPVGSALKTRVRAVDTEHNSITLTAREDEISSYEKVKVGAKIPARVLRITESFVVVGLGENITAVAHITEALDDYTKKLGEAFAKNVIVTATVLDVDLPNRKIHVSLRPDNSKDKLITSSSELRRGDIVRGFVKNISDKGVFVALGRTVTAYAKVGDLSDSYIKEWKKYFKLHQAVIGKVINADDDGHVTVTLKESEVNGDLNILKSFNDLEVGEVFEASVRKVTDFGVFVKLDKTVNISGLAHRSEISDSEIQNLSALFGEGDRVKVKILAIDQTKKQLSLGMKASYFEDEDQDEDVEMTDSSDEASYVDAEDVDEDVSSDEELIEDAFEDSDSEENSEDSSLETENTLSASGLGTNGFDWTAKILDQINNDDESSDEDDFTEVRTKKKKKSKQIVEDTTGDIQSKAPQSVADFERLIIGNPNSSIVWMNYMSFQLQLSEVEKAREIGERALKTINYREEQEKLNIWIALLNLENTFGTDETLDEVFKRSAEYMDSSVIHQKLVSIYILSEKYRKADALFKVITKKFGKTSVSVWVSFASYLLDRDQSEKAREILASALNSLPKRDHVEVVRKFAQLEFSKGDSEQGRSLFEGLLADAPKRIDLWNVYIDQEIKKDEKKKVEELFERVLTKKITRKQAKFFFAKWLAYEEKKEDTKGADYVKAKAQEYVQNQ